MVSDILLSEYGAASTPPSPVNRMMAAFADDFRPDVDINLGVGYVNEATIPRELILEAMQAVVMNPGKYKAALNYGGPRGSQNLIDAVKRFHIENRIGGLTRDVLDRQGIIIGPNGATSILEGIAHILKPGIVLTSDPMYYIYCNFLERQEFEVVAVPEDHDGIRTDLLREKIGRLGSRKADIRFLYVVTVNNPTGTILSNARRAELVAIVSGLSHDLGRNIPLFLDKAYEDLIHDPAVPPPESALIHDRAGLVYEIGTLSKILAPALRIGYMIGRDAPFVRAMVQKTSDAGFSAPLVTQEIAGFMLDHYVREQIDRVNRGYRDKARKIKRQIETQLGSVVSVCGGGSAGFYFYLTFRDIRTAEASPFFRYLARTTGDPEIDGPEGNKHPRVIYLPGEFCVHPKGDMVELGRRQLRLSYGYEEAARIAQAISIMREAADYARKGGEM